MAIVAADPVTAAALTDSPTPAMNGLVTWWFATDESPLQEKSLVLDASSPAGGPAGPVINAAVVSEVAPSYAPAGKHLVEATTLLGDAGESDVRRDLARMYGTATAGWDLIARHEIPHTLPVQPPPLIDRRGQRVTEHVFVAGDHRDTASINGALISGDRAARAISGILPAQSPR